jgi:hypothetical protein
MSANLIISLVQGIHAYLAMLSAPMVIQCFAWNWIGAVATQSALLVNIFEE